MHLFFENQFLQNDVHTQSTVYWVPIHSLRPIALIHFVRIGSDRGTLL